MRSARLPDSGSENGPAAADRGWPGTRWSLAELPAVTPLAPCAAENGDHRSGWCAWALRAPPLWRQNSEKRCARTSSPHPQYPGWTCARSPVAETVGGRSLQWWPAPGVSCVLANSSAAIRRTEKILCRSFYLFLLLTFVVYDNIIQKDRYDNQRQYTRSVDFLT